MKTLRKTTQLPLLALVLGGGLAMATTQRASAPAYYKDPVTGQWQSLGSLQPGTEPGQYQCLNPESDQCTAETLTGQTPGGEIRPGTFFITPED